MISPLELLFQCFKALLRCTPTLVKCHQKIVDVNTAETRTLSVFTHEPPQTRFQRRGDPAEMSHNIVHLRPPCSWCVYESVHGLPEPHTFPGLQFECVGQALVPAQPVLHVPVMCRSLQETPMSRLFCAHACVHLPQDRLAVVDSRRR